MTKEELQAYRSYIFERQKVAFDSLAKDAHYQQIQQRQSDNETTVRTLLHGLGDENRRFILKHFEDDDDLSDLESEACYIQGFRDCAQLFVVLGLLGVCVL